MHYFGTLDEQKKADIIAVKISDQIGEENPYDSLVFHAENNRVVFTMVNGEVLLDLSNELGNQKFNH